MVGNAQPLESPTPHGGLEGLGGHNSLSAGDLGIWDAPQTGLDKALLLNRGAAPAAKPDVSSLVNVNPAVAAQIRDMIQQGKDVSFVTPAEAQKSGAQPNFIIDKDGKLVANPNNPAKGDGPVTVMVDSSQGELTAKKMANELQRMSLNEEIAYRRKWNPNASVDDLQQRLAGISDSIDPAQSPQWPNGTPPQQADAPSATDTPQVQPASYQPSEAPSSGPGGPSGPGGGWENQMGSPPQEGRELPGQFDPSDNAPMDRSAIPAPVPGDLYLKVEDDPTKKGSGITADQIQQFLEKVGSPAAKEAGFSQALVKLGEEHGIDPAVALGFFLQESTCGRAGHAVANHSLGNIKGTGDAGSDGTFRRYSSWTAGASDWFNLMDKYHDMGLHTLSQVIHRYAPNGDGGNNESHYRATVKGMVEAFKEKNDKTATV